ncbi:type II toxin-antitoxin system RelE/ParE family toxin [Mucilaginibacter flavus]|uniref:type II toxin-antitoxin system RelE/ParE family toxin n=1 Tax=Mucilaginibacter flavus TaxID=931504 RepID=UPI0025B3A7AA|nr:type II toxin-antitoxin system RelE/ParE family toxin [Mucilaginibacter flavus]MDN3580848.1 type II toxin-antitoxin system RelE/ParE family toxin [Mucilaginibacter flavus]
MAFKVVLTPGFKRDLKQIAKKHKQILRDLTHLVDQLSDNPTMGTDLGQNVFKIRLPISGTNKGKSGGARIITFIIFLNEIVYLSEIYLKSEYDTVDVATVLARLKDSGII